MLLYHPLGVRCCTTILYTWDVALGSLIFEMLFYDPLYVRCCSVPMTLGGANQEQQVCHASTWYRSWFEVLFSSNTKANTKWVSIRRVVLHLDFLLLWILNTTSNYPYVTKGILWVSHLPISFLLSFIQPMLTESDIFVRQQEDNWQ